MSPQYSAQTQGIYLTQLYLEKIVCEARNKYNVPAIVVTTMNSSEILLLEAQGTRVVDGHDNVTLDDYFHIGSCSKSLLAVIAAFLVEQNRIAWDTRFFDLLPELKDMADSAYAEITLEDLLLSRAGIKPHTLLTVDPLPDYGPEIVDKRFEFIKHLISQPPSSKYTNGEFQHLYSNASYTMASAMLERVSDKTYEQLVTTTLYDSMGLKVRIGWPNNIGEDQPWGHMISKSKIDTFGPEHPYRLPELLTPAGDLSMTPRDYAEYTRRHLNGLRGNDNVIASASYRHIHYVRDGFALGVFNGHILGKQYSGFDGTAGTFFCRSIIVPGNDFAFTIMTNAGSATGSLDAVEKLSHRIIEKQFDLSWWQKIWLWQWWR